MAMAQRHVGSLDCGSVRGVALVVGNTGEVAEVRKKPFLFWFDEWMEWSYGVMGVGS